MTTAAIAFDAERAQDLAEILKAMGHPLRLRIMASLTGGTHDVGDLAALLGVPQSIMSQQLRILRMSGIVTAHREGGHAWYHLVDAHSLDLLTCLDRCGDRLGAARGASFTPTEDAQHTS